MRDDFPRMVVETLGRRAGMRCSNPKCRQLTSGPTEQPDKAINVGVAAHICAAAPGGRRYDASMTAEQRSDIENGIWLCQKCGKMVDNDPMRYTVAYLAEWKTRAEAEALAELESGRPITAASMINAAVVIQGQGAIQISGPDAVNIGPGGITIVGPVIRKD